MRESFKLSWAVAVVVIVAATWFSASVPAQDAKQSQSAKSAFSLTIAAEEPTVKAGTPVWVEVTLENKSDHDISIWRANVGPSDDQGGWVLHADVKNERAEVPPPTKFEDNIAGGSGGYRHLGPHQTITDRINLTKLYQLDRPGKYTIQIWELDNETMTIVRSNKITVAVEQAQSVQPLFSLTIAAEEPSVKAGSPVWVDATVENKSDRDISVYRENTPDQGGWTYKVDVWDEKGAMAAETRFGRMIQGHIPAEELAREPYVIVGSGGYMPLYPGKTLTDRVNLSKLYDLGRPGRYTVQFQEFHEQSKLFVKSNKITVTVTP
jgi:hypothetical protein